MKMMGEKERAKLLENVGARQKILETSLQAVVQGFTSALFLWGPPGLGKTHILTTLLDGMCPGGWKHHTAYSTPKALMLAIAECPNAIHLFEDCERLLKTDLSASLLRAACGAPGERLRWVTYETAHETLRVNFTGGIVIATNANLARATGPMQAVASRFRPMAWTMSIDERIALIMRIASHGWSKGKAKLTPAECVKVAHSLLQWIEAVSDDAALDIRLYTEHALPTFAHCKMADVPNWEDVLAAKLTGTARSVEERQHERSGRLQDVARLIADGPGTRLEKIADWTAKTGLKGVMYYRHLKRGKKR